MLKIKVNTKGPLFDKRPKQKVAKASKRALTKTMKQAEKFIKGNLQRSPAPNVVGGYKTGKYKRGIKGRVKNSFSMEVAPGKFVYGRNLPYADIVEFGRSASNRKITPRRKRALRFKFRGSTSYAYRAWTKPFRKKLKGTGLFKKASKQAIKNNAKNTRLEMKKVFS